MYKATSRKIGILLTGLILLAVVAILNPSICGAGMHELADGEMSAVHAQGFSSFTISSPDSNGFSTVLLDLKGVTVGTYTTIANLQMGNYNSGWDNSWQNVSLGTSAANSDILVASGIYFSATFLNIDSSTGRQLESIQFGADKLTGTIKADFESFTGTIGAYTPPPRTNLSNLGKTTITSDGSFNLSFDKSKGFSFNFGSATLN